MNLPAIQKAAEHIRSEFSKAQSVLTADEYFQILSQTPETQLRGSAQYFADALDSFGQDKKSGNFKLFESPILKRKIIGQTEVQQQIYRSLRTFQRQRTNNKMILLHGPNGSAKSSLVQAIMTGAEEYSKTDAGAQYTFEWVFPQDRAVRGSLGLQKSSQRDSDSSYAKWPDEEILARIPSDLKDHPLLLIPVQQRFTFLKNLLGESKASTLWTSMPLYLTQGELSHRCREIFDALMRSYEGDFQKVLRHVQVQRFYFSHNYKKSLITIEPQLHVDAQYQLLTLNRNLNALPSALHSLNFFSVGGELVDGNRGMIEFSDLLKRPVDTFKYLLGACETNAVSVGSTMIHLDCVFFGTCNEAQLDAFKEYPDFTSFNGRLELVRVPYLVKVSEESSIYTSELENVRAVKPIAPHASWALALWSVLTRLKKPNSINYPQGASSIAGNLSPLEKAKLLDHEELPQRFGLEERKILRANLDKIRDEYKNTPFYEGRLGASAREIKAIIHTATQNVEFPTVSPLALLREMENFVKRNTEFEFLRLDSKDGYHDCIDFIQVVRTEYVEIVDREVREAMGLYESKQWEDFLKKYVFHISLLLKKEKYKNPLTGETEDPDIQLIREFESIVEAPKQDSEIESFRQSIITAIGAWSLDHRNEAVIYSKVFPEYWKKLEQHYFQGQRDLLMQLHNAVLLYDPQVQKKEGDTSTESERIAQRTIQHMINSQGYTLESAIEVIRFLTKTKYQS